MHSANSEIMMGIYLDLQIAFDMIHHTILTDILELFTVWY